MAFAFVPALSLSLQSPREGLTRVSILQSRTPRLQISFNGSKLPSFSSFLLPRRCIFSLKFKSVSGRNLSEFTVKNKNYEFYDGVADVELRLDIGTMGVQDSSDIFVDANETSLLVRVKASGSLITLLDTNHLYEKIKPSETIWYIDEDQLVINLKKYDTELKWPDIMESWMSLTAGVSQLLKGTSVYLVGDSTEINQKVAGELASGIGYTPLFTSDLLERYTQQSIESWVISEGADSVAAGEGVVLESLSSHVRAVVATLGGEQGIARRSDKWQHLHAGFTVWLSKSEASDENSAKEEARMNMQDKNLGYTNADVVVKLGGWDAEHTQAVAQACLSALKQLLLSDKQLTGKKSLYIRLGCRGDWPNIKPPGWDPASGVDSSVEY
ncbi:probable inactive shikimate kinase like 2, chloroplastic [Dioscorea cayenensis subsp. rotundata]|uniref:Probable inactive shikimate kinase like 2, chloroplastic n=1 Tax=Dioscorea cayennensis subsp. rotundata TaxID=55577 RepID=A0AB40B1X5_DIOCR|nr:probable inactive shikimate kinase like 2, chloroplastic [Dioscorea cayenensis subsp. rotundata]